MNTQRPSRQSGFSLLELLVVVVIIGILASMFTLSIGVLGSDRELEREADRLQALVNLASEDAALQARELGLQFFEGGYEFSALDPDTGQWVVLSSDPQLRPRELADDLEMELEIEGRAVVLEKDHESAAAKEENTSSADDGANQYQPQIFIFSSGEISPPFALNLRRRFGDLNFTVKTGEQTLVEVSRENS